MRYCTTSLLLLLLLVAPAAAQNNYSLFEDVRYKSEQGVDANLLSMDIYSPTMFSGPRPVMVYIHGGYWSFGDKRFVDSKAKVFTDSGYVFVSINYRLSPNPADTLAAQAVRFPVHPADCADAVAWVVDNIQDYSGDVSKISVLGHSAGAHLALLLSTNHTFLQQAGISPEYIKCTCSLDAGMFDVLYELEQAQSLNNAIRIVQIVNAFGTDREKYPAASPIYNVQRGKYLPEIYLVHRGNLDQVVANYLFKDAAIKNDHLRVENFNASPYSHEEINRYLGDLSDNINMTDSVLNFFSRCLSSTATGVSSEVETNTVSVFPNPAYDRFTVSVPPWYIGGSIHVYGVLGDFSMAKNISSEQNVVHSSGLRPGVYTVVVTSPSGHVFSRKILKQ